MKLVYILSLDVLSGSGILKHFGLSTTNHADRPIKGIGYGRSEDNCQRQDQLKGLDIILCDTSTRERAILRLFKEARDLALVIHSNDSNFASLFRKMTNGKEDAKILAVDENSGDGPTFSLLLELANPHSQEAYQTILKQYLETFENRALRKLRNKLLLDDYQLNFAYELFVEPGPDARIPYAWKRLFALHPIVPDLLRRHYYTKSRTPERSQIMNELHKELSPD